MPPNGNCGSGSGSSNNDSSSSIYDTGSLLESFLYLKKSDPSMMDLAVLKELQQRHHAAAQALANM